VTRSRARAELAGAAHAIEPIAGGWLLPPAPPSRPVFEKMPLSPSRLDTYTRCERKFFFQRVLRIEEPGSIYLTIGNLFHDVLKQLVKVDMTGDDVRVALASDADEIIDAAINQKMPDTGEWVHELTKVHMRRMLDGARELESKREGTYRVLSVETAAHYPSENDAIYTGRLDRIDHVDGLGPVVIDYKTSAQMPLTAASILKGIEEERAYWQVVMYSALAAALDFSAKAFVYYVVPPGEEANAVGVQLAAGNLPHVIRGGGRHSRYDPMPPGLLDAVLNDAKTIHDNVTTGAAAYARTDQLENCKNCHFIRVCRRNAE
jgi:CRISPR/Cas system-associated exonuclease Cas4 (RecB family)